MAFAFGIAWRIMPEPTRRRNHLCQQIVSSALLWTVVHILNAMFLRNWMPSERNSFSTTSKCRVNGQNVQPHRAFASQAPVGVYPISRLSSVTMPLAIGTLDIGDGHRDEEVVLQCHLLQRPSDLTKTMNCHPSHYISPSLFLVLWAVLRPEARSTPMGR